MALQVESHAALHGHYWSPQVRAAQEAVQQVAQQAAHQWREQLRYSCWARAYHELILSA